MKPDPVPATSADEPPRHRVLHLVADRAESGPSHAHVVGVETETTGEPRRWALADFVRAYDRGEQFFLADAADVHLEPENCPYCTETTITTQRADRTPLE